MRTQNYSKPQRYDNENILFFVSDPIFVACSFNIASLYGPLAPAIEWQSHQILPLDLIPLPDLSLYARPGSKFFGLELPPDKPPLALALALLFYDQDIKSDDFFIPTKARVFLMHNGGGLEVIAP